MKDTYSVEYDILISKVHRWGEIIRFGGTFLVEDVQEDVLNCIELLRNHSDNFIAIVFSNRVIQDVFPYEIEAVNITILSLAVGIDLGLEDEQLLLLGVSALTKDLGMNKILPEILNKTDDLSDDEFAEIKRHTEYSVEIIKEFGFSDDVCKVIVDHHERWDGKGYPRGKNGESINFLARIISVLDGYSAMKQDRPYRESLHGYDAIKNIIGDNGQRYDPAILTAVVKSIGIYPIGSFVALNDASICRVVSVNSGKPLKPIVEVIINKDGTESRSNNLIDIADNNRFFIVKNVLVS